MRKRPLVIIGNWKMHKNLEEALRFVDGFLNNFHPKESVEVGLAVPFTSISELSQRTFATPLKIGAQNMNDASEGAFTGEIAGRMLKDAGAAFVILGHSERRRLFHEDNALINRKVKRAIEVGLRPLLCIGETAEQKESGQAEEILKEQLSGGLEGLSGEQLDRLIVAYEPIWAIGRGASADPEQVQKRHLFCRESLAQLFSPEWAERVTIQYGGSVNPANAKLLLNHPDIDGLLIGTASLSLESFRQIVDDGDQLFSASQKRDEEAESNKHLEG